ncbi:hypothetical protein G6F63_014778 [Rhizopus arrhizus]|nr:hypothetical protein G6F63_014778 [Rhizopus arrhizus]
MPRKPHSWPPASTAKITATGCRPILSPTMRGDQPLQVEALCLHQRGHHRQQDAGGRAQVRDEADQPGNQADQQAQAQYEQVAMGGAQATGRAGVHGGLSGRATVGQTTLRRHRTAVWRGCARAPAGQPRGGGGHGRCRLMGGGGAGPFGGRPPDPDRRR